MKRESTELPFVLRTEAKRRDEAASGGVRAIELYCITHMKYTTEHIIYPETNSERDGKEEEEEKINRVFHWVTEVL